MALTIGFFLYIGTMLAQKVLARWSFPIRRPILLQLVPLIVIALLVIPLGGYIGVGMSYLQEWGEKAVSKDEEEVLLYLADHLTTDSVIMAEYIPGQRCISNAVQI